MAEVQITGETLDNLAQKLETFSENLSPEERTTLQAMLVLAGQKIADADEVAGFAFGGSPFAPQTTSTSVAWTSSSGDSPTRSDRSRATLPLARPAAAASFP